MSTPSNKIPPALNTDKLYQPSDVTRVDLPKENKGKIGWRDFVFQFIPQDIRDKGLFPTTDYVDELKKKQELSQKIPTNRSIGGILSSKEDVEEHDKLVDAAMQSDEPGMYSVPSSIVNYIPEGIRDLFRKPAQPGPLNLVRDVAGEIAKDPLSWVEGPSGLTGAAGTFARGKIFSRLDAAIDIATHNKATGKQWLATISKNVPEQESKMLREMLKAQPSKVFTKEEVFELKNKVSPIPQLDEVVLGSSTDVPVRTLSKGDEFTWKYGDDIEIVETDGSLNFLRLEELRNKYPEDSNRISHFRDIPESIPEEIRLLEYSLEISPSYFQPKVQNSINAMKELQELLTRKSYSILSRGSFVDVAESLEEAIQKADKRKIVVPAKYPQYTKAPHDKEDYTEIIPTLNDPDPTKYFGQHHWLDKGVKNPVGHVRLSNRVSFLDELIGNRSFGQDEFAIQVRNIEELQSDWAQFIRREEERAKRLGLSNVFRVDDINDMPDVPDFENIPKIKELNDVNYAARTTYRDVTYEGRDFRIWYYDDEFYKLDETDLGTLLYDSRNFYGLSNADKISLVKNTMKRVVNNSRMPSMPFAKTDQWVDLLLGRAMQDAIDRGIDVLTWTPGSVQYDLYGSELVKWERNLRKLTREEMDALEYRHITYANADDVKNNIESLNETSEHILREIINNKQFKATNPEVYKLYEEIYNLRKNTNSFTDEELMRLDDLIELGERAQFPKASTERILNRPVDEMPEAMEIMVKEVIDEGEGEEAVQAVIDYYTKMIEFKKSLKHDYATYIHTPFSVSYKQQHTGNVLGFGNLEGRKDIKSKEDLQLILIGILQHPEDASKQADKIWARMQVEESGLSLPRKEGMEQFYGIYDSPLNGSQISKLKEKYKHVPDYELKNLENTAKSSLETLKDVIANPAPDEPYSTIELYKEIVALRTQFQDGIVGRRMKELGKKMGVNLELIDVDTRYGKDIVKQKGIKITPELKQKINEKGFPILETTGVLFGGAASAEIARRKKENEKNDMDKLFN